MASETGSPFSEILKAARERAGVTQAELAAAIGVSTATVVSWESGRRRLSPGRKGRDGRQVVIEICDRLGADSPTLNAMLNDLGFSPVPGGRTIPLLDRRKPLHVVQDECETYTWPALAMNEDFEVVGWNQAANDLSELDLGRDLAEPGARHLLRMALSPHYRDRLVNWNEVIGHMMGMWKSGNYVLFTADQTPYFRDLMFFIATHHPADVVPLLALWDASPARPEGWRLEFPVVWRAGDGTQLQFDCVQTSWSDFDGISAQDWHPADTTTWNWLESRRQQRLMNPAPAAPEVRPAPSSARELLRYARERNGLSRRQLAERSGISAALIYALETGKRSLVRATVLDLCHAMVLDSSILNRILDAAGFDPEPSDNLAYILGHDVSANPRYSTSNPARIGWTPAGVREHIAGYRYPCLVVNDRCEVEAANPLACRLLRTDFNALPPGPPRNLFAIVTDATFRQGALNWELAVTNVLPGNLEAYIAPPSGHRGPRKDGAYFERVIRHVREREANAGRGDQVIRELFAAWQANAHQKLTARVTFPLAWAAEDRTLTFNAVIAPWNSMMDPYWAIDLHPADAGTWVAISG